MCEVGVLLGIFVVAFFFKEDLPYGRLEKIQVLDPVCASPAPNSRPARSRADILIITLMACLLTGELHELLPCQLSLCDRRQMKMGLKWWIMEGEKSISLCKPLRASAAVACHRKCVRVWEKKKKKKNSCTCAVEFIYSFVSCNNYCSTVASKKFGNT